MRRVEILIAEAAQRFPENVAVQDEAERWTYRRMMAESEQIHRYLCQLGARAGDAVGIVEDGRARTVAAFLAVWRLGGVAVPLSRNTVPSRAAEMAEDAGLKVVLCSWMDHAAVERMLASAEPAPHCAVAERKYDADLLSPDRPAALGNRCYIYWTSGSQGRAKGVMGLHSSLCAYLDWHARSFSVGPDERFSHIAPLTFDFSLKEIFVPLIAGGRVCLLPPRSRRDPRALLDWLAVSGVTTFCCVPTMFRALTCLLQDEPPLRSRLATLRRVLISGEQLRWEDVVAWRSAVGTARLLFNLYGPTESTVIKFCYPIPDDVAGRAGNVPVGRPIDGAELRLRSLCADGSGEVVILSDWIAEGYCGVAADRGGFAVERNKGRAVRAYHTGDIGRLTADGDLVLLGRSDRQVKIHGHRVELDAVEATYGGHPAIVEIAALLRRIEDHDELVCFYQSSADDLDVATLRRFGLERLPAASVPTRFVRLDAVPLSANGKIDRTALGRLKLASAPALLEHESTRDKLARLWRETLAIPAAGPGDNFFELGGDSISAIRLLRRLRREFSDQVTLDDIFFHPTLTALADCLDGSACTGNESR